MTYSKASLIMIIKEQTTAHERWYRDMTYIMNWTQKDGVKVTGQLYTTEFITQKLQTLEREGATNITIVSQD